MPRHDTLLYLLYAHECIYTLTYTCTYMHTHIHSHSHMHSHTFTLTCSYTHSHTHIHIHTHTQCYLQTVALSKTTTKGLPHGLGELRYVSRQLHGVEGIFGLPSKKSII